MTRAAVLTTLLLAACNGKSGDSGTFDYTTFKAGNFQFTSYKVDDGCLDGGMGVLFLPEGEGTTQAWKYPIELPSWSDLPATETLHLQDPFYDMDVTIVEGGAGIMSVQGAEQTGVYFDKDNYADCTVDMNIDASVTLHDADNVSGTASMSVSNVNGSTCPTFTEDPCSLTLYFTGTRL